MEIKANKQRPKRPLTIEVDTELFAAVLEETDNLDWTIRQCVEWGFKMFLVANKSKHIKDLGINEK